jgi:hypothetical protein
MAATMMTSRTLLNLLRGIRIELQKQEELSHISVTLSSFCRKSYPLFS